MNTSNTSKKATIVEVKTFADIQLLLTASPKKVIAKKKVLPVK